MIFLSSFVVLFSDLVEVKLVDFVETVWGFCKGNWLVFFALERWRSFKFFSHSLGMKSEVVDPKAPIEYIGLEVCERWKYAGGWYGVEGGIIEFFSRETSWFLRFLIFLSWFSMGKQFCKRFMISAWRDFIFYFFCLRAWRGVNMVYASCCRVISILCWLW